MIGQIQGGRTRLEKLGWNGIAITIFNCFVTAIWLGRLITEIQRHRISYQPFAWMTKVSDWVRLLHMNRRLTRISKYLSFILRHHPESIGLKLDPERWASVDELVKNANSSGKSITLAQVQEVVALNEQKMFVISDDGLRIRAK